MNSLMGHLLPVVKTGNSFIKYHRRIKMPTLFDGIFPIGFYDGWCQGIIKIWRY